MYLVAHQDECLMVVGNVIHNAVIWRDDGNIKGEMRQLTSRRQCTIRCKINRHTYSQRQCTLRTH